MEIGDDEIISLFKIPPRFETCMTSSLDGPGDSSVVTAKVDVVAKLEVGVDDALCEFDEISDLCGESRNQFKAFVCSKLHHVVSYDKTSKHRNTVCFGVYVF